MRGRLYDAILFAHRGTYLFGIFVKNIRCFSENYRTFFFRAETSVICSVPTKNRPDPTRQREYIDGAGPGLVIYRRITSYNVCYTKLLRR